MNIEEIQTRLFRLGLNPGPADDIMGERTKEATRQFQKRAGLKVDGDPGPLTQAALKAAEPGYVFKLVEAPSPTTSAVLGLGKLRPGIIPTEWMPDAKMKAIVVHWTAGPTKATGLDREHYHLIIEGDGNLVRGDHTIKANEVPRKGAYAAHTLNFNTGVIGVSLACMAGAVENPFSSGSAPMTRRQWETLPGVLATLCHRYGIAVTPRTVLSHAEVQPTLGITQRGKCDISRLSFDPTIKGARACGDIFRGYTAALLP